MQSKGRKAKVTAENKEEARRLAKLWEEKKHHTQAVFGETYGVGNQSAVGQFLRGEVPLSMKAAAGFAKGLGCEISDFSPRLARQVGWPFPGIDRERFDQLSRDQQIEIQGVVRERIEIFEAAFGNQKTG